jgi:hypothetical protein
VKIARHLHQSKMVLFMKRTVFFLAIFLSFLTTKNSHAQLFNVEVNRPLTAQSVNSTFHSMMDAIDYFKSDNLNNQFGADVGIETININLNFRGLPASLTYTGAGTLVVQIDDIVTKTFTGTSRDDLVNQLKDYLKSGDGSGAIGAIQRRLAKVSPVDPVAGNPTSLMSQMVDHDFDLTHTDALYDTEDSGSQRNEMGVGAKYSQYNISGLDAKVLTVSPFAWRRNLGDSNVKLLIRFPTLTAVDTE